MKNNQQLMCGRSNCVTTSFRFNSFCKMFVDLIKIGLLLCLLLVVPVFSVEHSKFRTCEQSSFCRRNRQLQAGQSKWEIESNSVQQTGDHLGVEATIKHADSGVMLKLTLNSLLENGSILKIHINELKSERTRYEAKEALLEGIPKCRLELDKISLDSFKVNFNKANVQYSAVFHYKPFKIEVYSGSDLVLIGNKRGLFNFEHFSKKEELSKELLEEQTANGMWEEKFSSWDDSKPYGPMSVGMDLSFVDFNNVYGIPEHADSYSLKDTKGHSDPYRLFNTDVFEYELDSRMALYGSVPMMIAHSVKRTIGLLWLNPSETWIDIETKDGSKRTHWFSETGVIDLYLMVGETFAKVMEQNANLTGTSFLPPIYSIGYHQSRWNYFSENEVTAVDDKFDDYNMPVDAIWLDIEYTEGRLKKYFTWDPINFADPQKLSSTLNAKGRRLITIIDPHLKKHVGYLIFKEAQENHYLVKTKNNHDYEGWCWPGESVWPDFINPSVRHWWSKLFEPKHWPGFVGGIVDYWNDMNEPSVFNGPEMSMQRDLVYYNGFEHRDIHNVYGYLMTKSTYEGLIIYRPNIRAFILTRSFFAGSQKHCAAWTGDNMSKWTHLRASIPMILSLSSVGISFSGADVPGFFFVPESENLVIRWYQAGAFQPFFRAHAHIETKKREPWMFSNKTRDLIGDAIRLRQNMIPYLYTLFYKNHLTGMPPMRLMFAHFESEQRTFEIEDAYLLGESILVHPVMEDQKESIDIYLPGPDRIWLNMQNKKIYEGGLVHTLPVTIDTIPYFQLGGRIVPRREKIRRSAILTDAMNDSLVLDVFLDKSNFAFGDLYMDDGLTFKYKDGDYLHSSFEFKGDYLTNDILSGKRVTKTSIEKVFVYNYLKKPRTVQASVLDKKYAVHFKYDDERKELFINRLDLNLGIKWKLIFD